MAATRGRGPVGGGIVVHLGCGDGKLTAALHVNDSYIVQGLDADVAQARQNIQAGGGYGPVSVETWSGDRLPYVDNIVNLLVTTSLGKVPMDEVLRVLTPNGVALIGGQKTVKPRPKEMDDWTHYFYDARGNLVRLREAIERREERSTFWEYEPVFSKVVKKIIVKKWDRVP